MNQKPLNFPQPGTGAPPFPGQVQFQANNNAAPNPNFPQFGSQSKEQNNVLTTQFRATVNPVTGFPGVPQPGQPVKHEQPDNTQYVIDLKLTVKNWEERMKKKDDHYTRQLR